MGSVRRWIRCRLPGSPGMLIALVPNLVFQTAPLAAEFGLMRGAAGDRFGVVREEVWCFRVTRVRTAGVRRSGAAD